MLFVVVLKLKVAFEERLALMVVGRWWEVGEGSEKYVLLIPNPLIKSDC